MYGIMKNMKKSSKQIQIEKIKQEILNMDMLAPGRLRTTFMKCGNSGCACHKDETAKHGPYHLWDRKVGKKLTSKMVSNEDFKNIKKWIEERKKSEILFSKIVKLSQEIITEMVEKNKIQRDK